MESSIQTHARSECESPGQQAVVAVPRLFALSDRVSILNALMAQDRIEIRDRQEAILRLTYLVVPSIIGIAAFSVAKPELLGVLIIGQVLLLGLYAVSFRAFRTWLADARACLEVRESFYKNQHQLMTCRFDPLTFEAGHRMAVQIRDTHLWFPFGITVASSMTMIAFMFSRL
jgi:hypothetical protein